MYRGRTNGPSNIAKNTPTNHNIFTTVKNRVYGFCTSRRVDMPFQKLNEQNDDGIELRSIKSTSGPTLEANSEAQKTGKETWPKKICWVLFSISLTIFMLKIVIILILHWISNITMARTFQNNSIDFAVGMLSGFSLVFLLNFDKGFGKAAFLSIIVTCVVQVYEFVTWNKETVSNIDSIALL